MVERDWFGWHQTYDDRESTLARRLQAVRRDIVAFLDQAPPGRITVVSMCAGQGRDLLGVLADHPRAPDVAARLVELDPRNAAVAAESALASGLTGVDVVVGDASITTAYQGAVPCDLLLACGVFGHASDGDIRATIGHLPMLCAPRATVLWTRGGFGVDLRPTIRNWFVAAGFEELHFTSGDGGWGVGANRMVVEPQPYGTGIRLFSFLDEVAHR